MRKLRRWIVLFLTLQGFHALAISAPIINCTRNGESVTVSWGPVSGADHYVVVRSRTTSPSAADFRIGNGTSTTYIDNSADSVTTYYYWVEAWDVENVSARSNMATASGSGGGGGGSGSFSIDASDGTSTEGVVITWSAVSGATGYRVVRGNSSNMEYADTLVETVTGTTYTDTTAVAGNTYYYWVVAKKSSGYVTSSYDTGWIPGAYTVRFIRDEPGSGTMANQTFDWGETKALSMNAFTVPGYTFYRWVKFSGSGSQTYYSNGQRVSNLAEYDGEIVNLYARWTANTYTVKFNANGGSGSMSNESFTYDTAKALTANAFTRPCYTFAGWATNATGSVVYTDGQSVQNLTTTAGGTVNLYAVWTGISYSVKFNKNATDATGTMSNQSFNYGTAKTLKANAFTLAGYAFAGWATSASGAVVYNDKQAVSNLTTTAGAIVNLYAKWVVDVPCTVTFDRQGGSGGSLSVTATFGSAMPSITLPTRTGYTFGGYYDAANGSGTQYYTASGASARNWDKDEATTLYAKWTGISYSVKFNANGGTGSTSNESFTYGTAKTLTANAFSRQGYSFVGWATSANGAVVYNDRQSVSNLTTTSGGTVNLYAVWVEGVSSANAVVNLTSGSTSGYQLANGTTYVVTKSLTFSNGTTGESGMSVASNAIAVLYLPAGISLTATGADGSGQTGGGAGISVPESSTLIITGEGTVMASGGNAGDGGNGDNGSKGGSITVNTSGGYVSSASGTSGKGGKGGAGGGGAGSGIGGRGGFGGGGGAGAYGVSSSVTKSTVYTFGKSGYSGDNGEPGSAGAGMGTVFLIGEVEVQAFSGDAGVGGSSGEFGGQSFKLSLPDFYSNGGGGGGGGGAGASPSCVIGGGGASGGGGGGGGSGTLSTADVSGGSSKNAHGGCGEGGLSLVANGASGTGRESCKSGHEYTVYGGEGGAAGTAGAEGGAGTLYVSPTASVNVSRTTQSATTHAAAQYVIIFDASGGNLPSGGQSLTATLGCAMPSITIPTRTGYTFGGYYTAANGGGTQYYTAAGASARNWDKTAATTLYAKWLAITDMTAQQRHPWDGKVDIAYMVTADIVSALVRPDLMPVFKVTATDRDSGWVYEASTLDGDTSFVEGVHNIVWDMDADGVAPQSTNVVFMVAYEFKPATYCVIDLSAGALASSYPVTYLAAPPSGGFNVDAYKTTKLALRCIMPGTFMMCGQYETTLTKPYYVGVFEVTQKQFDLVMGSNPSQYIGDKRPVEKVTPNSLRGGSSNGALWPLSADVDPDKFMGRIQARTGLNFDLPTEAQWEYACRAGTTSSYNNGGNAESDLMLIGRYSGNVDDGKGGYAEHTTVGSYQPNALGLYDMHGNVWEWCLDWSGSLTNGMTDPNGPATGEKRVRRGGGWAHGASSCTSSHRNDGTPTVPDNGRGFRLARTLDATPQITLSGSSASIPLTRQYVIFFDRQGGSGGSASATATYGSAMPSITIPTRTGYTFGGYYTAANGGGTQYYTAAGASARSWDKTAATTLYAKWTANTYAVKFNANTGSGSMSNESFTYGLAKALTANAFTQTGYTFIGWATSANGAVVYNDGQTVSNLTATANGTVNLYARWSANAYSVKFNANTGSGSMSNESFTYGTAKALTANAFTQTGYTFIGWATSANGAVVYNDGQTVSNLTATASETVNLYAKWTANAYSVKFNANGGSGTMSNESFAYGTAKALTANAFTRTGYTFAGWATSATGAKIYDDGQSVSNLSAVNGGTVDLYAVWEKMPVLTIASTYGTCNPFKGTQSLASNSVVNASVTAPADANGVRRICTGWTGTGSVTASGTVASVSFAITQNSTLTWNWKTQYQISVTATGAGSCSFGTQWVDDGTAAMATVVPSSSTGRIKLLGDIDGVTLDGTTVSIPATKARNITVSVTADSEIHIYHVDAANGNDSNDGLSWNTAKKTIQNAIDLAYGGDTILVADGIYGPITAQCLGIEIRSVNGATSTIIDGGGTTRCALLGYERNDAVKTTLVGFTLRNGRGHAEKIHGAGVFGGVLEECVVTDNHAGCDTDESFYGYGGGLQQCIASHCVISNNTATGGGGGAMNSTLSDCLIVNNVASNVLPRTSGGGLGACQAVRSTIVFNHAGYGTSSTPGGAGCDNCTLESCIVYGNAYITGASNDVNNCTATYSCLGSAVSGTGNIVVDPLFVDPANGNYRLQSGSPCIEKGIGSGVPWQSVDLDGNPRRVGNKTDMGCYEFSTHREPTTIHVNVATGDDANDGLSPSAPKKSIQSALEWSIDGDTILVNDGVYTRSNGMVVNNEVHNRVITIRSVNGPERTIIDGGGANRCAKLSANLNGRTAANVATLSGFTVTNGAFHTAGGISHGVVKNCIIAGCTGIRANNSTSGYSGGAGNCKLVNCLIRGNSVIAGSGIPESGGAGSCYLYNCTVVGNSAIAGASVGGLYNCKVYNCIVVGNTVDGAVTDVASNCTVANSCLGASFSGTGNIVVDPLFVDAANGDYRLSADSPCIGAGDNANAAGETDLAGGQRIMDLHVDMGCYEFQGMSVTLDRQSGTGGSASVTATYGSAMPSITVPTRTGYTFGGYYTAANGGGTQYYTAAGASARNWDKTAATTLYAKWTANTYTVTLDRQSGTGGFSSVTATYGTAMPSITVPTREHYAFDGYYTAAGASARNWDKTEETTLYAKWEQTQYQISVTATGSGSCSFGTQWVDVGTTATATVVPSSSSYRIKLLGDINDVTLDGITLSIPATQKRNITVSVTDDTEPRTYHVDATNGDNSNDGLSWATAKKTIQSAIDLAYGGDTVLVADGIYSPITAQCLGIEIRSVNGAASTIIDGGDAHARCAFLGFYTNDVVKTKLVGFTLRNGIDQHGTGAYGGALEDCVVTGNYAAQDNGTTFCGAGLYNCMATRCVISNNVASRAGGGAWCSELADCLVVGNHVQNNEDGYCGGGTARSRLVRCTVAGNTAVPGVSSAGAAGADSCVLQSCIVYGNTCTTGASSDVSNCTATYSCLSSAVSGTGNIAADPLFVDPANGDYRLQSGSPGIDAGNSSGVNWQSVDLDGNPRRVGNTTDMGCYEFSTHREPTTIHVDVATGDDANDGLSSSAPKKSIQSALNWSIDGDTILVNDGVYTRNTNFVVNNENLNRIVTIRSVNGPTKTIIDGGGIRRCAKLSSYDGRTSQRVATLSGFMITNGVSYGVGGASYGIVENCVIAGCTGTRGYSNTGTYSGGASQCKLINCLILGNSVVAGSGAPVSGGAFQCNLYNCTVIGNIAISDTPAGGLNNCKAYNCIVIGNTVDGAAADVASNCTVANSCLGTSFAGTGNIVADPLFVDAANGDYRLSVDSPCIGAGDNANAAGEKDLAGDTRVRGLCVDMGCYEWQGVPATPVITPADGTILSGSLSVSISCATDGAVIHYTTDGSEPTAESPVYRRFRVTQRTIVKAVAVKDGLYSEVAVAEYAAGQCADPVITAQASFTGSKTSVTLSCATPDARIYYTTNGDAPNTNSTWYTGPFDVTDSCTVKAYATCANYRDSAVVTFAITKVWAIGDTMDAPDQPFTTGGNLPFVRVDDVTAPLGESMKSGAITHSQTSTLSTTVSGPGTVSFQWKTSCEDSGGEYDWDHAEFRVDGAPVAYLDGVTAWQTVTHVVSGTGQHTLEWRYVKDDVETDGQDCCWVADFSWMPAAYTATQTTEVPVPYVWLRAYFPATPDEYAAYETAAKAKAVNGVNSVWECYVAGLDPTNAASVFQAEISFKNGSPVITWTPDLNEGGTKHERVYTVEGKENLADKSWAPTNSASRFFRVKVEMP